MFFHNYPYSDAHELNLDWILAQIKIINSTLNNFIVMNTIKYADPFQWNITTQYESNTIVMEPNTGTAYISVQPVPAGISISNTDFWTPVFDLSQLFGNFNDNITFHNEYLNIVSAHVYAVGDWLIWKNDLYLVTSAISLGDALQPGTNMEQKSVEELVDIIATAINNEITAINNDIITINGDISDIKGDITDIQNDISDMKKIVDVMSAGAVGDGVTNDTAAIQAVIDSSGSAIVYFPAGTYLVDELTLHDGVYLLSDGSAIIKQNDSLVFDGSSLKDIKIEGITFENKVDYLTPTIFTFTSCDGITLDKVHLIGNDINTYTVDGIIFFDTCSNVLMLNCEAEKAEAEGVRFTACKDCRVQGGSYHDFDDGSAIEVDDQLTRNVIIDGVETYNCAGSSININAPYCTVRNCYCHDNGTSGINMGHSTPESKATYTIIDGNIVENSGSNGIQVQQSNFITITNNRVRNDTKAASTSGIYCTSDSQRITIDGNLITAFENGILGCYRWCSFLNNRIENCDNGIQSAANNLIIGENYIYNCDYGMKLTTGGNNSLINNNKVQTYTSYGIYDECYDYITNNFISGGTGNEIAAGNATKSGNIEGALA